MIIFVAIIVALVLIPILSNPATRACRWREYPEGDASLWRCAACGAEIQGSRGKAPKLCLRNTP